MDAALLGPSLSLSQKFNPYNLPWIQTWVSQVKS